MVGGMPLCREKAATRRGALMWDSLSRKDEASKTLARYKWLMLFKKLSFLAVISQG
ncbi:MAG TPA: hypothetical protein VEZ91_15545 [Kurthia gibsonii]|nr:hypothetical protein [Kurthia gibsonii]